MRAVIALIMFIVTQTALSQALPGPQIHFPQYADVVTGSIPIEVSSSYGFDVYLARGRDEILLHHSEEGVSRSSVVTIDSSVYGSGQYNLRVVDRENNEVRTSFLVDQLAKPEWLSGDANNYLPWSGLIKAIDFENDGFTETVFVHLGEQNVELVVLDSRGSTIFTAPIGLSANFDAWQVPIVTELDASSPNKELVLVRREIVGEESIAFVEIYSSRGKKLRSQALSVSHEYFNASDYYRQTLQIAVGDVSNSPGDEIVVADRDTLYVLDVQLKEINAFTTVGDIPEQIVLAPFDDFSGSEMVLRTKRCENYIQDTNGEYVCSGARFIHHIQAFNTYGEMWQREFKADEMFAVDIDRDYQVDLLLVQGSFIHRWDRLGESYEFDSWPVQSGAFHDHHQVMVAPIQVGAENVLLSAMWSYGYFSDSRLNFMRYINDLGEDLYGYDFNEVFRLDDVGGLAAHRIAVANLDDDPAWEFLVTTTSGPVFNSGKQIVAIDDDGSTLDSEKNIRSLGFYIPEIMCGNCREFFRNSPIAADIDNDGILDASLSGSDYLGFHWQSNHISVGEMAWGTPHFDEKNQNYFRVRYAQKSVEQVYFRGTPNGFGTMPMKLVDDHLWEIKVNFSWALNERFKFDIHGDWSENYGDIDGDGIADISGEDIFINNGGGEYVIQFNDSTFEYSVVSTRDAYPDFLFDLRGDIVVYKNQPFYLGGVDLESTFSSVNNRGLVVAPESGHFVLENYATDFEDELLIIVKDYENTRFDRVYYRSTTNNWSKTEMQMVDQGVWEIEVNIDDDRVDHTFKLDIKGDWSQNYGDDGFDGSLDQWGENIPLGDPGRKVIRFYEDDLNYEILAERPPFVYFDIGLGAYTKDSNNVYSRSLFNNPFFSGAYVDYTLERTRTVEQMFGVDVIFGDNNHYYPGYPWVDFEAPSSGTYTIRSSLFLDGNFSGSADITYIIDAAPERSTWVQFACHDIEVEYGEGVYVVGNHSKLGHWGTTRNTRLKHFGDGVWGKLISGFAENLDIEWKCVVADDETLEHLQWQPGENNHVRSLMENEVTTSRGFF